MKILETKPVLTSEAKEMLDDRKKEGELNYEQTLAMEHAEKFSSQLKADSKKISELIKKNEKIPLGTAVKIVDISPKSVATLKAVLLKDKVELSEEELNDVVKITG